MEKVLAQKTQSQGVGRIVPGGGEQDGRGSQDLIGEDVDDKKELLYYVSFSQNCRSL